MEHKTKHVLMSIYKHISVNIIKKNILNTHFC